MRDRFTRVLKGHIAVARAVFPAGTNGAQIDALARAALWRAGLISTTARDMASVRIFGARRSPAPRQDRNDRARAGNDRVRRARLLRRRRIRNPDREPGCGRGADYSRGRKADAGLRDLTLAPIDLSLVEPKLMDPDEIAWLDDYHARVRKTLSPRVDPRPALG